MNIFRRLFFRGHRHSNHHAPEPDDHQTEAVRVTNETVAAHREEVLGSARKYIYPLQAAKHRVVKISVSIFLFAVISFFGFCIAELYKFQSSSSFIYAVSEVLPFPVAILGHQSVVSYNDYLFELRHYLHYYNTQQHADFTSTTGKQQLASFKRQSMDQVLQNAYVAQLAGQHHITVSGSEVDAAVTLVRSQNRLGANEQVFESVLNEFWGWSENDFRRELRQELLAQKVVSQLDSTTHDRANQALTQLQQGADFASLATKVSDDISTRASGGDYGMLISPTNANLPPQVLAQLFTLKIGQYSTIIDTGYTLEIVKVTDIQGGQVRASHMVFNFAPLTTFTASLKQKEKAHLLIGI